MPVTLHNYFVDHACTHVKATEKMRHIQDVVLPASRARLESAERQLNKCLGIELEMALRCEHDAYRRQV